jgi:hypothetical protein
VTDVASPELANRLRELVAEAVGGARMVAAEPADGLGAVIIQALETNQALLWIRGGADDDRPALIQAMIPFDDRPIEVADEIAAAAVVWLTGRRGRWHETGPADD